MKKEFIPYEEALALKELGFNEPCITYFLPGTTSLTTRGVRNGKEVQWKKLYTSVLRGFKIKDTVTMHGEGVLAPLWQQAFDWFREVYNLNGEISWDCSYECNPGEWSDAIYKITIVDVSSIKEWKAHSPDMQRGNGRQLTYSEARSECLRELIKIVNEKSLSQ